MLSATKGVYLAQLFAIGHAIAAKPPHQPGQQESRGQVKRSQHRQERWGDGVTPGQDDSRHEDGRNGRCDSVGIERLDSLAIRHHPADCVARLKLGGARGRQRQHRVVETVAECRQDVERHVMPGVLFDIGSDTDDGAGYRDPLHLREDHIPCHYARLVGRYVDSHAGRRDAEHGRLRDDLDHTRGQRNTHDPGKRPHVGHQPPNDPRVARFLHHFVPGRPARLSSSCLVRIMPA